MIYLIDHQDSFTWNVYHQFSHYDEVYCSNYFNINEKKLKKSDVIVFSPGPGAPKDYLLSSKISSDNSCPFCAGKQCIKMTSSLQHSKSLAFN